MPEFNEIQNKIQKISFEILKNGKVDLIIGFKNGSIPLISNPCTISKLNEVSTLVWNGNCRLNLANYLINRQEKIGIIAKGCDSRNIITLISENKIKRDQLYIIGVPCYGMIDRKKLKSFIKEEILIFSESEINLQIITKKRKTITLKRNDFIQNNCMKCNYNNPLINDIMVTKTYDNKNKKTDKYKEIDTIEKKSFKEKTEFFDNIFSSCIRCYACKNSCPLCYCPTCFVDESNPQWLGKGQNLNDVKTFHFLRAYHCAGRCTDCGTCEEVCPLDINMRLLTMKMEKDCETYFNSNAGLSINTKPALDTYSNNDFDQFIK